MKSKDWLLRQKNDYYVKSAIKSGYLSRAAYKLLEIDDKYNLLKGSKNILELGSSPGGWSQVIIEKNKNAKIYAFDLLDMKFNHPNLFFFKEDFMNYDYNKFKFKFNLIISDIAPNTIGHKSTDHLRISLMIEEIIYIIDKIALASSSFIIKIWKGSEEKKIIKLLKLKYLKVSYFKPESSRSESSEIFIVAENYLK